MVTFLDAEISKKIVSNASEILSLIEYSNEYLESLIIDNQNIIDTYNLQNILVIDLTPTEIGRFNANIKKIAVGYFKTYDMELDIDKDNSLLQAYTIFSRKMNSKQTYKRNSLENATTNIFKTEIINQLIKLNKHNL